MKVALLQFDIVWENKAKNFKKVRSLVEKLMSGKPDLVVLPELAFTGYTMNPRPFEEDLEGETYHFLSKLARDHQVNVLGSLIERTGAESNPKNSAILLNRHGEILLHYSKINQPSFLGENEHYTPGNEVLTKELEGQRIGVFICYDLRNQELFGMMAEDVGCIFVIANWPHKRIEHWDTLLKASAILNQSYIVGVNRVGSFPSYHSGHSAIFDPWGKRIAYAREDEEDVLVHEIDFSSFKEVRNKLPALRDKRKLSSLVYKRL